MWAGLKPQRLPDCASDLRLDAWLAGELAAFEGDEVQSHVGGCERCRERHAAIARDRDRFAASALANPAWLNAQPTRTPATVRARWAVAASLAVAACAALAVLASQPRSAPLEAASAGLRAKGAPQLGFYVKRGERVQRGSEVLPLLPGDLVRFTYSADSARYVAVLSVDAARRASLYYPAQPRAAWAGPGTEVPLPTAVELDTTLGSERIVALFCDTAVPLDPLLAELAAGPGELRPPSGCTVDELRVTKQAAP